ncbi:MAG TPA: Fic family protein [Candidatus Nanoarchaeia archaeon]|nr:Fic family protein [Candidatus Nanoarchaeia archaeon]
MAFVRRKSVNGKLYYYLVKSVRNGKNIERYIGLNQPGKKDIQLFEEEHSILASFLEKSEPFLSEVKKAYRKKLARGSKDEITQFEEMIVTQLTYNTNRIEGSRLTYKDTNLLLNHGIVPGNKTIRDVKETENLKKVYLFSKGYKKDIDESLILSLHRILKEGISEDAGAYRTAGVMVGDMVGLNCKLISLEIKNLLAWYNKNKNKLHPLELTAQFHCTFERIHPFFDGNGRVGRLLLNHTLSRKGYPPLIIQDKNKKRYYNALIKGQKGNYYLMIKYMASELENMLPILR